MSVGSLSVVMANYNHAHFISEALRAILHQTYRPTEIIIVDDASTDDSVTVIEQCAKRDPIIHLLRNDWNRGPVFSANRALDIVSGDYVYFASANDKVLPGLFEKSMSLLAQYPQAGLCCSDPASFDTCTGIVSDNRLYWSENPRWFSPDELAEVVRGGYVAGHTSVLKRSALLEAGRLIPELKWHCDWFAMLVIGFRHGICYIPESLATIRVQTDSYSNSGRRQWAAQREVLNHLLRLLKSPDYRDVLPLFALGSVMSQFGDEIVRVVKGNPEHWDIQSIMLIKHLLREELRHAPRRMLGRLTPSLVKRAYCHVRHCWPWT